MLVVGREFSEDILSRIRRRVADEPTLTRTALSREVCGWLQWHGGDGRPKDVSCRVALLRLARRGLIELPAAKQASFARAGQAAQAAAPSGVTIEAPLMQLGRVWLVPVDSARAELSRSWWAMMQAHHPLGAGPLCGAQLRYLVACEAGVLGGLSFSAPAWRLAPRDAWIGWDDAARRAGLSKVVANSRFLILPGVRVPHLASHVLALALKRLRADWQARYGVAPVLVETFVDGSRWRGTCYRAANWRHLGRTQGRGRQDRTRAAQGTSKDIWVYPLHARWQSILQGTGAAVPMPLAGEPDLQDWAQQEFGGCKLPDARLQTRLLTLARDFYARPTASLTQACSSRAKTKAAYRFLDHEHTTMDTLLQPHYLATQARVHNESIVLAVQDTSTLNYTTHAATQGLGPIGTTPTGPQGLQLHSTLAFNVQGTPLGFIDVQCWARDADEFGKKAQRSRLPIEDKESHKWLKSMSATAAVQASCPGTTLVSVGDREADVYELFEQAAAHPQGPKLLVRARHDRKLQDEQHSLWETMQARAVDAVQLLQVPRQGSRAARQAQMEIRYAGVSLKAPAKRKGPGPAIAVWAVLAQEHNAPVGVTPLQWMLLTTVEVASVEHACERLMWYSRRWGIEVLHRTLKSGCRIEQRQLGQADRLEACLAIDLVVAWRIYHLCKLGREAPQAPCTVYFEEAEWKALMVFMTKKPVAAHQVPTLREMIHRVATLGGFQGRRGDGEPGTQTLWLGLQRLDDIVAMWQAMTELITATQMPVSSKGDSG